MKVKIKLVEDWRHCWKWFSMWCLILSGAVSGSWSTIPPEWQQIVLEHYPEPILFKVIMWLSIIGIIGRLTDQRGKKC